MELDDCLTTLNEIEDDQEDEPFGISWLPFSNESKDIHALLLDLVSKFCRTIPHSLARKYVRIFSKYGLSLQSYTKTNINRYYGLQYVPAVQIGPNTRMNLAAMLRQISNAEYNITCLYFLQNYLKFTGSLETRTYDMLFTGKEAFNIYCAVMANYRCSIEYNLETSPYLRQFRSKKVYRDVKNLVIADYPINESYFAMVPQKVLIAIQMIITNLRSKRSFVSEQLTQIAYTAMAQLAYIKLPTDALAILQEATICALGLNYEKNLNEMVKFAELLKPFSKRPRFLVPWTAWQVVFRLEACNIEGALSRNFEIDAEHLADAVFNNEIGVHGCVFVEIACKIWHRIGENEDDMAQLVTNFVRRWPSFGSRMIGLVRDYNIEYEVDPITEDCCGNTEVGLHPSDRLWLNWIEKRIKNIERFGSIEETVNKCLVAAFGFLDYANNRMSSKAWVLLHSIVQMTSRDMVWKEWESRCDWWPKFHKAKNGLKDRDGLQAKKEVMEALISLNDMI